MAIGVVPFSLMRKVASVGYPLPTDAICLYSLLIVKITW